VGVDRFCCLACVGGMKRLWMAWFRSTSRDIVVRRAFTESSCAGAGKQRRAGVGTESRRMISSWAPRAQPSRSSFSPSSLAQGLRLDEIHSCLERSRRYTKFPAVLCHNIHILSLTPRIRHQVMIGPSILHAAGNFEAPLTKETTACPPRNAHVCRCRVHEVPLRGRQGRLSLV
jgi:hypothetical protein